VAQARATVLLWQCCAEHAQLAHVSEDVAVELFMAVGLDNARHQPLVAETTNAVADLALGFAQAGFEGQQIVPGCSSH